MGKPRPDARDPATCAGLTCANPAALGHDRESQTRGGGFLSLTRDMRVTMSSCIHIDTRVGPLGLPARTGLLTAHTPAGQAPRRRPRYMRGDFTAYVSSRRNAVKIRDDLLVGTARFGSQHEFPGCEVKGVADPLQVGRAH